MKGEAGLGEGKKRLASRKRKLESKRSGRNLLNKRVSDDPTAGKRLDEIRKRLLKAEARYRDKLYEGIVQAARIGLELEDKPRSYREFCRDPFWACEKSRPDERQPSDAVRFAIKRAAPKGRASLQRSSFYYRAMRAVMDAGIPADRWVSKLKSTGLRELARQFAQSNKLELQVGKKTKTKVADPVDSVAADPHPKQSKHDRERNGKLPARRKAVTQQDAVLFIEEKSRLFSAPKNQRIWMEATIVELGRRCEARIHQWSPAKP